MKVAKIISIAFHPVLVPSLGILTLLNTGHWLSFLSPEAKRYIYLVVLVTTIILPLTTMPLLKNRGWIKSYSLFDTKERRIPLLIGSFFYLLGAFILQKVHAPMIISIFLNASAITILMCALITWRWKISNHMAALGGLAGLFLAVSLNWMANFQIILGVILLITGIVAAARLTRQVHTPWQVYVGFVLGFLVTFLIVRFL